MFFPDKAPGLPRGAARAEPGGRFIFNVWDRIEENEFAAMVVAAGGRDVFPDDPPRFLARMPHGYHDRASDPRRSSQRPASSMLRSETLTRAAAPPHPATPRSPSARDPAAQRDRGAGCRPARRGDRGGRRRIGARFGTGAVDGMIQAHVITAS